MNSLEFINKEVETYQAEIEHLKNAIRLKPVYADTIYECERGKECQARLNVLNQIKTELEAWEVVKEELQIVFKSKNFKGEPLQRYELNVVGKNKIDTLEKALKVEDE